MRGFFFVADLVGGSAEIARQFFGQLHVERLIDGGENLLLHQLLDHQVGLDAELFGKLLDRDAFGDGDFAIDGRRLERFLAAHHRTDTSLFILTAAIGPRAPGLVA